MSSMARDRGRQGNVRATGRGCPPVGGATAPAPGDGVEAAGCPVRMTGRWGLAAAARPAVRGPVAHGTGRRPAPTRRSAEGKIRRACSATFPRQSGVWLLRFLAMRPTRRAAWSASPPDRLRFGGPAGCAGGRVVLGRWRMGRAQAGADGLGVPGERCAERAERRFSATPRCDRFGFWRSADAAGSCAPNSANWGSHGGWAGDALGPRCPVPTAPAR